MKWYRHWNCVVASLLLAASIGVGCDKSSSGDEPAKSAASESGKSDDSQQGQAREKSVGEESEAAEDDERGAGESTGQRTGPVRGRVQPGDITEANPDWGERFDDLEVDRSAAEQFKDVPPGAEVTVYFGTWCSDSRREVPRLWKSLEAAGGDVPFSVEYIAVDRNFEAGDVSLEGIDLDFVPTFVVKRKGKEVGRIVESAPNVLEKDLLGLLTGETSGVVSGRSDL